MIQSITQSLRPAAAETRDIDTARTHNLMPSAQLPSNNQHAQHNRIQELASWRHPLSAGEAPAAAARVYLSICMQDLIFRALSFSDEILLQKKSNGMSPDFLTRSLSAKLNRETRCQEVGKQPEFEILLKKQSKQ